MVFTTPKFLRHPDKPGFIYSFLREENKNNIDNKITGQLSIEGADKELNIFDTEVMARKKLSKLFGQGYKLLSTLESGIELPLNYFWPDKPTVRWYCGRDENGKISSIFKDSESPDDIKFRYLYSIEDVKEQKNLLEKAGWRETPKPKISTQTSTEQTKTQAEILQDEKLSKLDELMKENLRKQFGEN